MAKTLRVLQNKGKTQIFLDGKEITGVERDDVYITKNDTKAKIRLVLRIDSDLSLIHIFFGAAFATGLAPIISMIILSPHFLRKKNEFHFTKCKLQGKLSIGILSSGIPSLVTEVSSGIVMIVFNSIIMGIQGNIGVAAYGVIANLSLVVMAIYTGIALSLIHIFNSI